MRLSSIKMLIIFLIGHSVIYGQIIGIYEFTGTGACPNPYTSVTNQPENAVFSEYTSNGVNCSSTNDVYNNSSWNTSNVINLNEYNEFSIIPDSCYSLTITSFTFSHRVSNINTVPAWYLRSSVDNFSSDLGSGTSGTTISASTINLPSDFTNLNGITFRLYLTSVYASSTTWRNDNVSVFGTVNSVIPQLFYADLDEDSFGSLNSTVLACEIPIGFVGNDFDCNDTDSQIHPYTVWYQDSDLDNYGDANEQFIGCAPPSNYVLNSSDCDDSDPFISIATQIYYLDEDSDGYGSGALFQTSCSQPNGYVSNQLDCDDTDHFIFPSAIDIFGNNVDENCDGTDGYLEIFEETPSLSSIQIYPNPSIGIFTITLDQIQNADITLKDLQGKEIARRTYSQQMDFSIFNDGVYLVEIKIDNRIYNKMITINR